MVEVVLYPTVEEYAAKIEEGYTDAELEWWALFCVAVAGKNADTTRRALNKFLKGRNTPFGHVRAYNKVGFLFFQLEMSRIGQYDRISKAFVELASHDGNWLRTCTVEDLEAIHGIGPKTARFFIMSTRKDVQLAALDTHILKWLESLGYEVPKTTPKSGKVYDYLEKAFTFEAQKRGKTNTAMDYEVWLAYKNGGTYEG